MRTSDWFKAVGVALLVMALDLAIATLVITFYVSAIDPGHPQDYYLKLAPGIATPSTAIAGPVLMFVACSWLGRRKPERSAFGFAVAVLAAYYLIDWGMVLFQGMLNPVAIGIAVLKLAGALLGAWTAQRWPRGNGSATA